VYDWLVVTADRLVPGGRTEAALAVDLALADLQSEAPVVMEPAKPPTSHLPTWQPHSGAVLYLPATCGWFNGGEDFADILTWLSQWRGWVGLNFEATGSTGNLGVKTTDWKIAYAAHAQQLTKHVAECVAMGIPVKIDAINSNDFGKGWSASWQDTTDNRNAVLAVMRGMATDLYAVRQWCIVQPVSESKWQWMPPTLAKACFNLWTSAGWEKPRLCMSGGIQEHHTGELQDYGKGHLAATDNGPAIEKHFGKGVWTAHTPDVARCTAYARHYLGRGVHASLYHRADKLHLLEHAKAYEQIVAGAGIAGGADKPAKPDQPGPQDSDAIELDKLYPPKSEAAWKAWPIVCRITGIERTGDGDIRATFTPRPAWKTDGGAKGINGNWSVFNAEGHGGTFEFTVTGDAARDKRACEAIHGATPGSVWYFVLTAVCRNGKRTRSEGRSQVFKWVAP
jgi:hypothetical protein